MKKTFLKSSKSNTKLEEAQTIVLMALCAGVLVLSAIVAVLLAQADSHRQTLEALTQTVSELEQAE